MFLEGSLRFSHPYEPLGPGREASGIQGEKVPGMGSLRRIGQKFFWGSEFS